LLGEPGVISPRSIMATTELEVIDTAIKIGLGSLITLTGTFLVT